MADNDSNTNHPYTSGGYGVVANNMLNGTDDGEDQINPKQEADSQKYASTAEVAPEKDLSGIFDKGGK